MYHCTIKQYEYNAHGGSMYDFEIVRLHFDFYKYCTYCGNLQLFYSDKISENLSKFYIFKKDLMDIL